MLMRTQSSDDARSSNLLNNDRQQRGEIHFGTLADPRSTHRPVAQSTKNFSPVIRRTKGRVGRQRRLTDSMVLEEASDTYLKAFSEQVARLKHLTDGLQRVTATTSYSCSEDEQSSEKTVVDSYETGEPSVEPGPNQNYRGPRSNWRALPLVSGHRLRSLSASHYAGSPQSAPNSNRTGDTVLPNEPHWQQARMSPSLSSRPQMGPQYHRKSSAPIPTMHNASAYECNTNSEVQPFRNNHYNTNQMDSVNRNVAEGNTRIGIMNDRSAAPLAKPEPLTDLEKPAVDSRQYSKQAAMAAPTQAHRFGSSTIYHPDHQQHDGESRFHQKTIRFADEEDDRNEYCGGDDAGVMSEAETTATSGSNSAVRRRLINQQMRQENDNRCNWNAEQSGSIRQTDARLGDASPTTQRRPPQEWPPSPQQPHMGIPSVVSTVSNSKAGAVFLQYQGETKRSVLPHGHDGTTKSALQSMDDVRMLFLKAFQAELTPEYVQSPVVKIYIQDQTKTDVFYELEDLSDVKDRAVLKLHECPTRPNSPPVQPAQIQAQQQGPTLLAPPTQHGRVVSPALDRVTTTDANYVMGGSSSPRQQLRSAVTGYNQPYQYNQHQSSSLSDDMNYFSEPEFDASRDYRVRKSSSTSNYSGSPVYQLQQMEQRRHYGTLDRYCGSGVGGVAGSGRGSYRAHPQVPTKPDRHFGPGVPSGGRASMCRSQSPPRIGVLGGGRPVVGHSTDPEDAYSGRGSNGSRDYAPSPSSDALMDALYNRPPSVARSGSVTPVIDEEARIRMINMEKQLANLSTLVHSALMSKGGNETVYKDLEMLRREILGTAGGMQQSAGGNAIRDDVSETGSISRFSDVSSDKGSYQNNAERDNAYHPPIGNCIPETATSMTGVIPGAGGLTNPETRHALKTCKRRVCEIQTDLKNLRRLAQLNAQSSRDVLKDAFDRIKVILNTNKHIHAFAAQAQQQNQNASNPLSSDRNLIDQEQDRYRKSMQRVERDLGDLEKQVEELRQNVISGERKLRIAEVESFTEMLGQVGKTAAHLKTNFPVLQDRLKQVMSAEMEKVVKEEKFLKDEPSRVDTALKRCKKLTNTMVTMKKLAMVQDPSAYYGNTNRPQSPAKPTTGDAEAPVKNDATNAASMDSSRTTAGHSQEEGSVLKANGSITASNNSKSAPSPAPKAAAIGGSAGGHVLDSLLEELQNVAKTVSVNENGVSGASNGGVASTPSSTSTINGSAEKNGSFGFNALSGEKRVGFADEVQVMTLNQESNDSDTIKRAPKLNSGYPSYQMDNGASTRPETGASMNGIVRQGPGLNGFPKNGAFGQQPLAGQIGSRRRSASPLLGNATMLSSNTLLHPSVASRSHSGTPCSVTSDPSAYGHYAPPPPPPRSSSRTMLAGSNNTPLDSRFNSYHLVDLKQPLNSSNGQKSGSAAAAAIVQTNAVDEEPRLVKSASSSDSVNSQDGRERRLHHQRQMDMYMHDGVGRADQLLTPPGKPPPPPPPPRNKQEMLEQRQHELMAKQLQQQQSRYVTKF